MTAPRFETGPLCITTNAAHSLVHDDVVTALDRHIAGDWGELDEEDRQSNEQALAHGGRLFSAYRDRRGTKFWIITESDRSVTTILLPEDY